MEYIQCAVYILGKEDELILRLTWRRPLLPMTSQSYQHIWNTQAQHCLVCVFCSIPLFLNKIMRTRGIRSYVALILLCWINWHFSAVFPAIFWTGSYVALNFLNFEALFVIIWLTVCYEYNAVLPPIKSVFYDELLLILLIRKPFWCYHLSCFTWSSQLFDPVISVVWQHQNSVLTSRDSKKGRLIFLFSHFQVLSLSRLQVHRDGIL